MKTNPAPGRKPPGYRDTISLYSDVLPDGTWGVTLQHGKTVRWLSRAQAYEHAAAVMSAAVRAQHDAAVLLQATRMLELPLPEAGAVLEHLRSGRPPVDAAALHPLELTPGVTVEGKPFLTVGVGGHRLGQWTVDDARGHAMACLAVAEAADLDRRYYRWLLGGEEGELKERYARAAVAALADYMPEQPVQ